MLKVAGLPEPSQNKPDDTIPFFISKKCMDLNGLSNKTAAHRLPLAEKRGLYERKNERGVATPTM